MARALNGVAERSRTRMDWHSRPCAVDEGRVKQGQMLIQHLLHHHHRNQDHCHHCRRIETTGERVAAVVDVAEAKANTCCKINLNLTRGKEKDTKQQLTFLVISLRQRYDGRITKTKALIAGRRSTGGVRCFVRQHLRCETVLN